jgi:group I intron endonuclease
MTNDITYESDRIIYIYCVRCLVNNKVYIGQTVKPSARWWQHRNDSINPKVPFHFAIKKYGAQNFEFEVIATCKGQDNANELETLLIAQYDSFISNNGYNATHGGMNAPKTEEWKKKLSDWHASLTPEEKAKRSEDLSQATLKQIADKGHPAQGTKRTEEQKAKMSAIQKSKDNAAIYTEEVRKRFSEAHIGIKDSEETKQKKSEQAKKAWEDRIDYSRKCEAPNCDVHGKAKYKIVNGIRYCNKHGLRMLRYQRLDALNN